MVLRVYYETMGRDRILEDPAQLVDKAFELIDSEGYERFSARKLAGNLGISHMTVYNYMGRDQLLQEVIIKGFSVLNERILPHASDCISGSGNPLRIFTIIADKLLDFAKAHENMYRFMFQTRLGLNLDDQRVRKLYSSGIELIKDLVPTEQLVSVQRDAYLFLVLVNGLILGYLAQRHSVTDEHCRSNIARAYALIMEPEGDVASN